MAHCKKHVSVLFATLIVIHIYYFTVSIEIVFKSKRSNPQTF